jgi:putative peptidoglycan lipid II flippase
MFKRILRGKSETIASAAVIVASFSILSRLVGFVRDRILAGMFGASDALDVYFAAFRIPDFFFQLVVVGALSASFIPLFTKYYGKKKNKKSWALTSNMLNMMAIVFGLITVVTIALAPFLAPVIAPGFDAAKQASVVDLTRIMLIAQLLLACSMVFGSVLQGAKHFVLYSLAPIFYNVGIITGAVVFVPMIGLTGLAWGVVFGAFLHLLIQAIGVFTLGYSYRPTLDFKNSDARYVFKHMGPRVLGLAVNQINFVVMTMIASLLAVGSVTMLQFAYNLNFFPIGVIGVSYAIAAFPSFCEQYNKRNKTGFINMFSSTARQMLFFIVPATVIFILLRAQIVRVVLGAGQFDWDATITTADTLGFFAISFFAQAFVFILVRAYFAQSNTWTPFFVGVMSAFINIVAAWFLSKEYGVLGLGMAYSIAAFIQLVLLWLPLRRSLGGLDEARIARSFFVLGISGAACAGVVQAMKQVVVKFISLDTFFGVLSQGLIAGMLGLAVYALVAYLLKSEEMYEFLRGMKRRLFRKAKPEEAVANL